MDTEAKCAVCKSTQHLHFTSIMLHSYYIKNTDLSSIMIVMYNINILHYNIDYTIIYT